MNVGNASSALASLTAPTPAQEPPKPANKPADDTAAAALEKERRAKAFEHMVQEEMERKRALADATPLPQNMMPWQNQVNPFSLADDTAEVEAAEALTASGNAAARAFQKGLLGAPHPILMVQPQQGKAVPGTDLDKDQVVTPVQGKPLDTAPQQIHVVVEPELPVVQPQQAETRHEPVPLVQFPQFVAGTAQQAVKDGQPVTQLDFEITPPHVGPVTLNVSLQERVVNVQLVVPSIQAKAMLENQLGAISSILQSQNLTPGQVRIITAPSGKSGAGSAGQQQNAGPGGFGMPTGRKSSADEENLAAGTV